MGVFAHFPNMEGEIGWFQSKEGNCELLKGGKVPFSQIIFNIKSDCEVHKFEGRLVMQIGQFVWDSIGASCGWLPSECKKFDLNEIRVPFQVLKLLQAT